MTLLSVLGAIRKRSAARAKSAKAARYRCGSGWRPGPAVADVVGARKFFYDVWGDAVNVASRIESTDVEGRIQVPHSMYQRLKDDYVFEERGLVDIKGKGPMRTWYLVGRRNGDSQADTELEPVSGSPARQV